MTNNDATDDLLARRYARQIILPEVQAHGQHILSSSRAIIIGAGGLGCPAALYLAAAGVGYLRVVDADRVEISNLHRQILYRASDIGEYKATVAAARLMEQFPTLHVESRVERAVQPTLNALLADADIVLDCSDNFATRFAVNAACAERRLPLISGAAIRFDGQVINLCPADSASPCYRCLYPDQGNDAEACEDAGILPPVAGVIASLQATEALKALLAVPGMRWGLLQVYDARHSRWQTVQVPPDPDCPICSAC